MSDSINRFDLKTKYCIHGEFHVLTTSISGCRLINIIPVRRDRILANSLTENKIHYAGSPGVNNYLDRSPKHMLNNKIRPGHFLSWYYSHNYVARSRVYNPGALHYKLFDRRIES